jgi:hypothetical protein
MDTHHCPDEIKDIQDLLEQNYDLLAGDQIAPENPRRWLLIKKEMPVTDPSTGTSRWNLDFLFVDQDAVPTLVECKLFKNTESRRQIVGQLLEYAANGREYWDKEELKKLAQESAERRKKTFEEIWKSFQTEDTDVGHFFSRVEENLKAGQMRLIFFLEEAPNELKILVDFLNEAMGEAEVLLVEARQFSKGTTTVVLPTLFGYTAKARRMKRKFAESSGRGVVWDWNSFAKDASEKGVTSQQITSIKQFLDRVRSELGARIEWGTGNVFGSFGAKWPFSSASPISVYSNGRLAVNFGWVRDERFRKELRDLLVQLGLNVPDDYEKKSPAYAAAEWCDKTDSLIKSLGKILPKASVVATAGSS